VHADTQGQSALVFTLATLFGFNLMPLIRNFQDLIFFRASAHLIRPTIPGAQPQLLTFQALPLGDL
jgi:TnpA family transposase